MSPFCHPSAVPRLLIGPTIARFAFVIERMKRMNQPKKAKSSTPKETSGRSDQTTASAHGIQRPKLPHERDESMDGDAPRPNGTMKKAYVDANSSKLPTDRSLEADAASAKLRGKTPGPERDGH